MTSTHIIRRQFLDVELVGTESEGLALQNRLPDLCQRGLIPALDRVLERVVPPHEYWSIDRLDIDAGSFRLENLERDLVDALAPAIERQIRQRSGSAGHPFGTTERRTGAQSVREAFLYFLDTGRLPWWLHLPPGETFEDAIRATWRTESIDGGPRDFAHGLIGALASGSRRTRLAKQFSAEFLDTLLASLSPHVASAMKDVLVRLETLDIAPGALKRLREHIRQTAFGMAATGERPTAGVLIAKIVDALTAPAAQDWERALGRMAELWPELRTRSRRIQDTRPDLKEPHDAEHPAAERRPVPAEHAKRGEEAAVDLDEGIFVACAGLVLLHPFLPRLFEALGIAKDDRLVDPQRALGLLHQLSTGQNVAPEYDLLLPKLLCSLPLDTPVDIPDPPNAAEQEEADALLSAVIRHWDALGTISPAGLRESFLMRPGKLSRRADGEDALQVEPRSYDVLLDRLPWGIGMIQLPWMRKLLWVEWRF